MPPEPRDLAVRYRAESDQVILDALAVGHEGYAPEAWQIITAEATRRGIESPTPVVATGPASDLDTLASLAPLPTWLSATLLVLAGLFLVLQALILMAYYRMVDQEQIYIGSTSTLALGITAWTATRFIRAGPHAPLARKIGWAALGLSLGALALRLLR